MIFTIKYNVKALLQVIRDHKCVKSLVCLILQCIICLLCKFCLSSITNMFYKKHKMFNLREHLSSPQLFGEVRVGLFNFLVFNDACFSGCSSLEFPSVFSTLYFKKRKKYSQLEEQAKINIVDNIINKNNTNTKGRNNYIEQ